MSHVNAVNLDTKDPRIDSVPVAALKNWAAMIVGGYEALNVVGAVLGLGAGFLKTAATTVYVPYQKDLILRQAEALYNRTYTPMGQHERRGTLNVEGSPSVREMIYTESYLGRD